MLRRAILMLTMAAIAAVVLVLVVGVAPAAVKSGSGKTIQCVPGKVCKGTPNSETIYGTDGNDDINPFNGNDTVYAKGGDDYVHHSYGDDTIEGGPGKDTLRGGFGHDKIYDDGANSQGDGDHDLLDCAWLGSRGDSGPDEGFGEPYPTDTVVDCSNRDDQ